MPFYESRMVRMVGLEPTCPAARDFKSLVYTNFTTLALLLVRKERLELSRLAALEPKSSASTNSATLALLSTFIPTNWYNGITFYFFITSAICYPHSTILTIFSTLLMFNCFICLFTLCSNFQSR